MKVILLGKGSLAIKIAEWFHKNSELAFVVPDQPEPDWTDSLTQWCEKNCVKYTKSGDYKNLDVTDVDLVMSVFYGKIFSQDFIKKCRNIINLHNGPLPKYRGVRPINWALKNGERQHGVTIHKIFSGIDNGDILGKVIYPIYPEIEEVEDVYKKSLDYGWLLFLDVISKIEHAIKNSVPQSHEYTYYSKDDDLLLGDRLGFKR